MMDEERDLKDGDERVKAAEFRGEVLARLGAIETKLDRMNGLRECVESTRVWQKALTAASGAAWAAIGLLFTKR